MKEEKIVDASIEEVEKKENAGDESGEKTPETKKDDNKKMKNLVSLCILLGGLFLGSLFVDLSQVIKGGGISRRVIENMDIFSLSGKTWVAYSDPIVNVRVIGDSTCEECATDEITLQLKQVVPTLLAENVDGNSDQGKKLIDDLGIKSIPAFVFSKDIEKTEFYAQAKSILDLNGDSYVLNSVAAGLPVGRYMELPTIGDNDIKHGPDDAKVRLIEFSDFQCPYCKAFHVSVIDELVKTYGDKIQLVFKQLPLESIHPNAKAAALASECANEQGKFVEYADKLFGGQEEWKGAKGAQLNQKFKTYAVQIGMNVSQFGTCLDTNKYTDKIGADVEEAAKFGISGTPALFINDQFKGGVSKLEDLKAIIDEQLGVENEDDNNASTEVEE